MVAPELPRGLWPVDRLCFSVSRQVSLRTPVECMYEYAQSGPFCRFLPQKCGPSIPICRVQYVRAGINGTTPVVRGGQCVMFPDGGRSACRTRTSEGGRTRPGTGGSLLDMVDDDNDDGCLAFRFSILFCFALLCFVLFWSCDTHKTMREPVVPETRGKPEKDGGQHPETSPKRMDGLSSTHNSSRLTNT
jgi:hypothetical protein